jgi:hypothetical protein
MREQTLWIKENVASTFMGFPKNNGGLQSRMTAN